MDHADADRLVKQLATGFETLQDEYQKLFGRHQALERKLATAREQVSLPTRSSPHASPIPHHFMMRQPLALDL